MVTKIDPAGSHERDHAGQEPNDRFAEQSRLDMHVSQVGQETVDPGVYDDVPAGKAASAQTSLGHNNFGMIRPWSLHRAFDPTGNCPGAPSHELKKCFKRSSHSQHG